MHLLHSSIAYPGYCAGAAKRYLELNKGKAKRAAPEYEHIRKVPKDDIHNRN